MPALRRCECRLPYALAGIVGTPTMTSNARLIPRLAMSASRAKPGGRFCLMLRAPVSLCVRAPCQRVVIPCPLRGAKCRFQARRERGVDLGLFGRRDVKKGECPNRGAARHELARIYSGLASIANNDDAPIPSQKFCVAGEVNVGEHFENCVYPAIARRFQDFFQISALAVVENLVCSLPLC